MSDRELLEMALEALEAMQLYAAAERKGLRICDEAIKALRARLAAPRPEPGLMELAQQMKPLDADMAAILHANLDSLYIEDEPAPRPEPVSDREAMKQDRMQFLRAFGGYMNKTLPVAQAAPPAAAPEKRHPGYVIGSHWLETAYSRVCAGEAEADVLRDCGWERVTDAEALRRDAERYRWLRVTVYDVSDDRMLRAEELDAAIDAAMEPATEPAIRARGEVPR